MHLRLAFLNAYVAALLLSLAALVAGLPEYGSAAPVPKTPTVHLTNPIEVNVPNVQVWGTALLPDNETVVIAGVKPKPPAPDDKDYVVEEAPPAGALVNFRTQKVRPFLNGHTTRIKDLVIPTDGSRIVTVSSLKEPFVSIWDVKAGKPLKPVQLPKIEDDHGPERVACFSQSKKIALLFNHHIAVVDPTGGVESIELRHASLSDHSARKITISPDDKLVACSILFEPRVLVWDVNSKQVVCSASLLPEGAQPRDWSIGSIGFTKDGKHLIASRYNRNRKDKDDEVPIGTAEDKVKPERRGLFLIDIGTQEVTPLGMGNQSGTNAFAFSSSEDWLAIIGASRPDKTDEKGVPLLVGELRIYHFQTRTLACRVQFNGGFSPVWVGFTADGKKLVTVETDIEDGAKVRTWDFTVTNQ